MVLREGTHTVITLLAVVPGLKEEKLLPANERLFVVWIVIHRDRARTNDSRKRYQYPAEFVDKKCCLRLTGLKLQEVETTQISHFSYAAVCLYSSVSLKNEKLVVKLVETI